MNDDREVRGAEAILYLRETGLEEEPLRIASIATPWTHPALPYDARALTFTNSDAIYVLNRPAYSTLGAAFGPQWEGNYVRMAPNREIDVDGAELFGMRLEPLWRCRECREEFSADIASKLCPWCKLLEDGNE